MDACCREAASKAQMTSTRTTTIRDSLLVRVTSLFGRDHSLFCGKNSLFAHIGNCHARH
jgi:hypothetical protein